MTKMKLFLAGCAIVPMLAQAAWREDYDQALTDARGAGKAVLLNFSGSDWCGWCMKLDREVFNLPEFQKYADTNLVLVKLDFPRRTPQPKEIAERNETLAKKYMVNGFPTLILLNSKGRWLGRLGYQPGGPEPFINSLKDLIE